MMIEWDKQLLCCAKDMQTHLSTHSNLEFDFGINDEMYSIVNDKLCFRRQPLELD